MTTGTTIRTETEATTTTDVELPDRPVITDTTTTTRLPTSVQDEPMVVETQETVTTTEPGPVVVPTEPPPLFIVDPNPSTSQSQIPVPVYDVHSHTVSLGERANVEVEIEPDSEDDVIVYDAPNPRISTPKVELTTLANISAQKTIPSPTTRQINQLRRNRLGHRVGGRNARRPGGGTTGVRRKILSENENYASFMATILRSEDNREDKDPKTHLRRQGDSDLDWGDEADEDEEERGPTVATAEGMDLGPDLVGSGVTTAAMERFVEGVNGNHVTMDDLESANAEEGSSSDEMDEEDEDEDGTDDEDVESDEERMLIEDFLAAQGGSDFSDDDEEESGLDPRAGFQARLDKLRKKQQKMIDMEDNEDQDGGEMDPSFKWDKGDEIDVCTHVFRSYATHTVYPGFCWRTPRRVREEPGGT